MEEFKPHFFCKNKRLVRIGINPSRFYWFNSNKRALEYVEGKLKLNLESKLNVSTST